MALQDGGDVFFKILEDLRTNGDSKDSEKKLYEFARSEEIQWTKDLLIKFACEQYFILESDKASFQSIADRCKANGETAGESLFSTLAEGEGLAQQHLVVFGEWLGLTDSDFKSFRCNMIAQAYPGHLARLSVTGKYAFLACACAVNFPVWGKMCGMLLEILRAKYPSAPPAAFGYLEFFSKPISNLDELVVKCMAEANVSKVSFELESAVRLLQDCEVLFWDSLK
mmetsp:Transcript_15429/g.25210  ORF Transcript_15429/g.25210 Transcript_15429/m.25210 type:complete len:226 (-) Transcript_15429:623-1300(-)